MGFRLVREWQNYGATTFSIMTFSITTLSIKTPCIECHYAEFRVSFIAMLSVIIQNVIRLSVCTYKHLYLWKKPWST